MKKQNKVKVKENRKEQGMALVLTMMCLMLCTSLGLAVLFNSTGEAALSGGFMRNEQAFYGADAGIGIAREAIRKELNNTIKNIASGLTLTYGSRTVQDSGIPYQLATVNSNQLSAALANPNLLGVNGTPSTTAKAAVAQRISALTKAGFEVDINVEFISSTNSGIVDLQQVGLNASLVKTVLDYETRVASATGTYRYTITSTGNNNVASGTANRATAKAVEVGMINATLEATINKGTSDIPGSQSFSEFGTFYDKFPSSIVVASGTYQGKVHSNEAFRFNPTNSVTFQGALTQSAANYIHNSNSYAVSSVGSSTNPRTGITVNSGFTQVPVKPLPSNSFSQELSVLNSTGKTDATFTTSQPSTANLTSVLRSSANAAPTVIGGIIADGVYLPTSGGTAITGGGIYVKGNVTELNLSISGESQVYAITQASGTTTITITPPTSTSVGQTIISNGAGTKTYLGVPIDKSSSVSSEFKPGVSLFVNGSITAMHGPAAVSGIVPPSISKNTALSITSTSDIQITGSITYQEPALTATGTPQTYAGGYTPKNVLGIFTNSGKIVWTPNSTYSESSNKSMTVDAAMAVFNSSSATDTGGWTTNCSGCTSTTKMTLRGSRSASRIIPILAGSQTTNRFFDPRFANSIVTPPFFPSTLTGVTVPGTARTVTFGTTNVQTIANTWQRTYS
jgi:PilX N-terminal